MMKMIISRRDERIDLKTKKVTEAIIQHIIFKEINSKKF